MGSQIPDEGKAGPQSQLKDAWMINFQKGRMPGFFSMRSFFGMVTCIFRMWFAWQTPWKTSGMQTGGTKCLSATFLVKSYHFVVVLPACQTCSVNMRPETGTLRPRYVRWFEDRWSVILLTRLPLHPKGACDSKFKSLTFPKSFLPDKHIRSISDVNPVDRDFSHSVEPLTVELNLCRLQLWDGELELACVGPVLLANPPWWEIPNERTERWQSYD